MTIIKFIKSNLGTIIILSFFLLITFNPTFKAFVMSGLIRIGLFNPNLSEEIRNTHEGEADNEATFPRVPPALFKDSSGKTVDLAELKDKVIFLNFWATWCPPCIAEMPSINSLHSKLKDNKDLVFLFADVDGDLQKSTEFMKKKKFELPVYIPGGPIPEQLFKGNLPTTLIINKDGEIIYSNEGMANYDTPDMLKFLSELSK
jgi:thiol-disulfide isomerase/thioredoxin